MNNRISTVAKAVAFVFAALVIMHWLIGGQQEIIDGPPDMHNAYTMPMETNMPLPTTLAGYQQAFDNLPGRDWGGGDVAVTDVLRDGRAVWFFGDTLTERGGVVWLLRNTALVQTGGTLRAANDGTQIIPSSNDNLTIWWPRKVKESRFDGLLKVWCMKIQIGTTGGIWDFERVHKVQTRVAKVRVRDSGDMAFKGWIPGWTPEPTDASAAPPDGSDTRAIEEGHWGYMKITHYDLPLANGKYLVTESQNWETQQGDEKKYRPMLSASD